MIVDNRAQRLGVQKIRQRVDACVVWEAAVPVAERQALLAGESCRYQQRHQNHGGSHCPRASRAVFRQNPPQPARAPGSQQRQRRQQRQEIAVISIEGDQPVNQQITNHERQQRRVYRR